MNSEIYNNILVDVKSMLGITGVYQDKTIQCYIDEVKQFLLNSGIKSDIVNSERAKGIIARGVLDLWNYGNGNANLSQYFIQCAIQFRYEINKDNSD